MLPHCFMSFCYCSLLYMKSANPFSREHRFSSIRWLEFDVNIVCVCVFIGRCLGAICTKFWASLPPLFPKEFQSRGRGWGRALLAPVCLVVVFLTLESVCIHKNPTATSLPRAWSLSDRVPRSLTYKQWDFSCCWIPLRGLKKE